MRKLFFWFFGHMAGVWFYMLMKYNGVLMMFTKIMGIIDSVLFFHDVFFNEVLEIFKSEKCVVLLNCQHWKGAWVFEVSQDKHKHSGQSVLPRSFLLVNSIPLALPFFSFSLTTERVVKCEFLKWEIIRMNPDCDVWCVIVYFFALDTLKYEP